MSADKSQTKNWIEIANNELGVSEVKGSDSNPRILEYHKTTLLHATSDEVPWCGSFMNWVMLQAGFKGTCSAAARSWETWGDALKKPQYGCIVVLKRGTGSQGHVGFYVGEEGRFVKILGGNQGDKVSIENFSKDKVISYRWPKGA